MFASKQTMGCVLCASVLLIGGVLVTHPWPVQAQAAATANARLKDLLKEKLAALQTVAAQATKMYESGETSTAEVLEAKRAVMQAELDLCETDMERMIVLEKMLAQAKDYEKKVAAHVSAGVVPTSAALKAKVSRLEIEIALERIHGK